MANDSTQGTGNGLLYGIIGALCVVVAGGGFYIYQNSLTAKPATEAAQAAPAAAVTPPAPPVQVAPKPAPPPTPASPTAGALALARSSIADARHLAARGSFGEAEAALQTADRLVPGFAETAVARREIAEMRTAHGQTGRPDTHQNNQLAALIATARAAIARHDYTTADRALDDAEKIDGRDAAVVQTRNELLEAMAHPGRPPNRNPPAEGSR